MKTPEEIFDEALKANDLDTVSIKDAALYEAGLEAIRHALRLGGIREGILPTEYQSGQSSQGMCALSMETCGHGSACKYPNCHR